MRVVIATLLIAFLSSFGEFFLPWLVILPIALVVTRTLNLRAAQGFLAGFLGVAIFWLPNILFKDFSNGHILSTRMAGLMFHSGNYPLFILVSAALGSIIGGLGGLAGGLLRKTD
jgi:hypothetical protein